MADTRDRVRSLDALRGFDMFWIAGADALVAALRGLSGWRPLELLSRQLEHADWEGFRFEDLIFPLFLFLAGVSLPWSLAGAQERGGRREAVRRLLRRGIVLWAVGVLYYGGFSSRWPEIRLVGVLQRIALCSMAAGLLLVWLPPRRIVMVGAGVLLGYWLLLALVPVPGFGAPSYLEGRNLTNWVDRVCLPGKKWDGDHDPEGLLSTLPAVVTCLLGCFAGRLLRRADLTPVERTVRLAGWGLAALAAGWLWGLEFPVIKKLWTSSYVLVAGGWSMLLLAAFHVVIDVGGLARWAVPFEWIGANSLAVYLFPAVVDLGGLAARFTGGDVGRMLGAFADTASALVQVGVLVLFARFLYRRGVFFRL